MTGTRKRISRKRRREINGWLVHAADRSLAMPPVRSKPSRKEEAVRLARLRKVAGAVAYAEGDPGRFRDLLEAVGLLAYEKSPNTTPESRMKTVVNYSRPGS